MATTAKWFQAKDKQVWGQIFNRDKNGASPGMRTEPLEAASRKVVPSGLKIKPGERVSPPAQQQDCAGCSYSGASVK